MLNGGSAIPAFPRERDHASEKERNGKERERECVCMSRRRGDVVVRTVTVGNARGRKEGGESAFAPP